MAEYRPIKTKIWHDAWFCSLDPEEKCFWLFLLTNDYVQISGIYELPIAHIEAISGCPNAKKIMEKFKKDEKIDYKNGFVFIKNYLKNQTKQFDKHSTIGRSILAYLSENPKLVEWFNLKNDSLYIAYIEPRGRSGVKIESKKVRKVESKKEILSANADEEYSFDKQIKKMFESKDRRMAIIAYYWTIKKISYQNKETYQAGLKRELRPASLLTGYTNEQIKKTCQWLQDNADFKFTLETVHKYIDENLDKMGQGGKPLTEEDLINKISEKYAR